MRSCTRTRLLVPLLVLLGACSDPAATTNTAADPPAGQVCELDGMTLADFPGPKGQIRYAGGDVSFFCDTVELLSVVLAPEQVRKVDGAYTQDMAKADWEEPAGNWVRVQDAFWVEGSSRNGSMGPTLASFAQRSDAEAFAKEYGGKVLAFSEITPDKVRLDGGTMTDHGM